MDVIDKMRYISRKELAKHRALFKNDIGKLDFELFEAIDLKNENEISIKDIITDD